MRGHGRVKRLGERPGPVPDPRDAFFARPRRVKRHADAVARERVTSFDGAAHHHFQPIEGRVHGAGRPARCRRIFREHVPRLERAPELERDVVVGDGAELREAELVMNVEPLLVDRVAGRVHVAHDLREVLRDEVREQETVVQRRAPARQLCLIRRLPERREQRADEELLREAHPRMGRHLEGAHLDEPQPAGGAVGRVELVDAELRAVGVSREIREQVAERPIDEPRRRWRRASACRPSDRTRSRARRGFVPRFVHARRLAGRADEQPREQIRERRVVVPVAEETP